MRGDRAERVRFGRGVLASYANTTVSIASNLVIIPMYLRYLGDEQYGLWVAVGSVVAYFGLANFGLTQATANAVGECFALRNWSRCSDILSSALVRYGRIAAACIVATLICERWIPWRVLFGDSANEGRFLALIAISLFIVELPLSVFAACLRAIGRIDLQQLIAAAQGVSRIVVASVVLVLGGKAVALVIALAATNVTFHLAAYVALSRKVTGLRLTFINARPVLLGGQSSYFFLLQLSGAIAFSTDALVISAKLGPEMVAKYAAAQKLSQVAVAAVTAVGSGFAPGFLSAYARRDFRDLRDRFRIAVRVSAVLASSAVIALLLLGPSFLRLWAGEARYVGGLAFFSLVFLAGIQMVLQPFDLLLTATSNHRLYAVCGAWEACLNLFLSVRWVGTAGIAGVVLASIVARMLGAVPVMIARSLQVVSAAGRIGPAPGSAG